MYHVITLYDFSFEYLESYTDNDSRVAVKLIEKELIKELVKNLYCPNDQKVFVEKVDDTILKC